MIMSLSLTKRINVVAKTIIIFFYLININNFFKTLNN